MSGDSSYAPTGRCTDLHAGFAKRRSVARVGVADDPVRSSLGHGGHRRARTHRYFVEEYRPGSSHFTGPRGFDGFHAYEVVSTPGVPVVLRHPLKIATFGFASLSWPIAYRPMHDALVEGSLATAEASLGQSPDVRPWSLWGRFLRWVVSGGKARPQVKPARV